MIIYLLSQIVNNLLGFLLSLVPLPDVPESFYSLFDYFAEIVSNSMGFIALIVPMDLVRTLLPIVVVMYNWNYFSSILIWCFKKIPFLGFN